MKKVFLLIDQDKNVVALYDDEDLAKNMKLPIEQKLGVQLTIEKRTINIDLKMIGAIK